jgi:N-acetylneuraminic acid mutarotase
MPTNESSNDCYAYDFVGNNWKKLKTVNGNEIPKVDSHSACIINSKMYVFGGYLPEKAEYLRNMYCLDL